MRLAPEGVPFIAGFALVGLVALAAAGPTGTSRVAVPIGGLFLTLAVFSLWFFRDPTPAVPSDPAVVVSPGQGKVIAIDEVHEPSFIGGPARKISIFLNVFDVHVQRAPVTGRVEHKLYKPGAYAVAWADKASEDNEQSSLGITTDRGKVLVRQIAGLVARRIVTDPVEGDSVTRGERVGLIRFGSRVDLFLPPDWEVTVAVGDRVRVGATALARMPAAVPAEETP